MLPCTARRSRLALIAAFLGVTACGAGYLSPILFDSEVEWDPALVAEWRDAEPGDSATGARARVVGDTLGPLRGYLVTFIDEDGDSSDLAARLGRLDGVRILELRPSTLGTWQGPHAQSLMLRAYAFLVVHQLDDGGIRFSMLEPDALESTLRREPGLVPWLRTDDVGTFITADPERQRIFLRDYLNRPGVLGDTARWVRVR